MFVIGTAGHVDHGKSALVSALSGMHPDRLKEEITREMTIDLGFAWMELPNQTPVGIVDVPGHRDFIENMLAGVGGIDAVLFVIAVDEGVMPQTREHLAIIDLLQIDTGIVVLNKIDLIDDPDWLDLVELDVREVLKNTVLENAPFIQVSAKTGQGISELQNLITSLLITKTPRPDLGRPRLSVDRVFSLSGFGTIVTGTLLDGSFKVGDEIILLPDELKGRIRGLQSHKHKQERAFPGSRTAINISGINKSEIRRGTVVSHPDTYVPTRLLDLHFHLLNDLQNPLKHNTEVKLFIGAAEVLAQCRVLGSNEIKPGEDGFIQLRLNEPIVAFRGDHYILRRPSPAETLGGGKVLDSQPQKIHRRYNIKTIESLTAMLKGNPEELILQSVNRLQAPSMSEILSNLGIQQNEGIEYIQKMLTDGLLINLNSKENSSQQKIISQSTWQRGSQAIVETLEVFHKENPLKPGINKESLKAKVGQQNLLFDLIIEELSRRSLVKVSANTICLSTHKIEFSAFQKKKINDFMEKLNFSPYSPPGVSEAIEFLGNDLFEAIISEKIIMRVSEDVIFSIDAYDAMVKFVKDRAKENGSIALSELRDNFQTSRKYALALLEHLDTIGITIRIGDLRKLRNK